MDMLWALRRDVFVFDPWQTSFFRSCRDLEEEEIIVYIAKYSEKIKVLCLC